MATRPNESWIGLAEGAVRLAPYTAEWQRLFSEEQQLLTAAAGGRLLDIQHVGSTAIPGMIAKPIIDICAAVDNFEEAAGLVKPICGLGYTYKGEHGIPRRHYFVKGNPRTHHLHIVERNSKDWAKTLCFRDVLIDNPQSARKYARLKIKLAGRFERQRKQYQEAKGAFIESVLEAAMSARRLLR